MAEKPKKPSGPTTSARSTSFPSSTGGAQPQGAGPTDFRSAAAQTLDDYRRRLAEFRNSCGTALQGHVDRSFGYIEGFLDDETSPGDWIKNGFALWIQCYSTGRGLYDSTCKLVCPPPSDGIE